jgi:hypothetical protein
VPASTTVIEVPPGDVPPGLSGVVRVAADRNALWSDVLAVVDEIRAAGGEPALLVARRGDIYALPPPAPPKPDESLRMVALSDHHQVCVSLPGVQLELSAPPGAKVEEKSCVSRLDHMHVDRSHVRELVRRTLKQTGLTRVRAVIDPSLSWADALRAIDGARTCCGTTPIEVSVETM